jgi:hypothetical protein
VHALVPPGTDGVVPEEKVEGVVPHGAVEAVGVHPTLPDGPPVGLEVGDGADAIVTHGFEIGELSGVTGLHEL